MGKNADTFCYIEKNSRVSIFFIQRRHLGGTVTPHKLLRCASGVRMMTFIFKYIIIMHGFKKSIHDIYSLGLCQDTVLK